MTTQAGLDAAYATEINNCTFRADAGPKKNPRPAEFCDTVEVQGDVTLNANLTVAAIGTFGSAIVVGGETYRTQSVLVPGIGFLNLLVGDSTPVVGLAPSSGFKAESVDGTFFELSIDSEKDSTDLGSPIFLSRD